MNARAMVAMISEAELMPLSTCQALKAVIEQPSSFSILDEAKKLLTGQLKTVNRCIDIMAKERENGRG